MEKDKQQLLSELKSNPKVTAFLAGFEESSVERFLTSYVNTKHLLLQYGENWRQRQGGDYFRTIAEKFYWLIAQKKLFNLQCLWRAEQISLPVTITYEFYYWSKNIKACPFLEDITETEMDVMIQYLEQAAYDHEDNEPWDWQAHDEFRDDETRIGAGDNYPAWYEMYDNYLGAQYLMTLPDVRGEREEKYLRAWRSSWGDEIVIKEPSKPSIYDDNKTTEDFIRKVEGYKILDYYRLYQAQFDTMDFREKLEFEMDLFMKEPEEIRIPEGKFPDAIFQAGHLLRVSHIKSLLPEIHESHLERKAMNISYEQEEDPLINDIKDHIKIGMDILEEGEDR